MWGHGHSGTFLSNRIARPTDQLSKTVCLPSRGEPGLGQGNSGRRDGCIETAAVPFITWLEGRVVGRDESREVPPSSHSTPLASL